VRSEVWNVARVTRDGERSYEELDDRGYAGLRFTEAEADLAYGLARTPAMPTIDGERLGTNAIMSLYPNTNISVYPNFVLITVLTPHAPDRTDYDSIMLHLHDVATESRWSEQRRYLLTDDWANARTEDAAVLHAVQAGRRSPAFDQHFYAPFWDSMIHRFNQRILDDLEVPRRVRIRPNQGAMMLAAPSGRRAPRRSLGSLMRRGIRGELCE